MRLKILVPGRGYQELNLDLVRRSLGLQSGAAPDALPAYNREDFVPFTSLPVLVSKADKAALESDMRLYGSCWIRCDHPAAFGTRVAPESIAINKKSTTAPK